MRCCRRCLLRASELRNRAPCADVKHAPPNPKLKGTPLERAPLHDDADALEGGGERRLSEVEMAEAEGEPAATITSSTKDETA